MYGSSISQGFFFMMQIIPSTQPSQQTAVMVAKNEVFHVAQNLQKRFGGVGGWNALDLMRRSGGTVRSTNMWI